MAIRFSRSASRHGISRARAGHVVEHCPCPLYSWAEGDEDIIAFLGPDGHGVPLEVIALELADGDLLVIHAMKLRRRYLDDYARGDVMAAAMRTKSGRALSDAELDRLAARAELGFDLASWKPRRGRPSLDAESGALSPRIAVRVPDALRRRAVARAASEGKSMSEVVRGLLEGYVEGPVPAKTPASRRR